MDEVVAVVGVLLLGITSPSSRRSAGQGKWLSCRLILHLSCSMHAHAHRSRLATTAAWERQGRRERYGAGVCIVANDEERNRGVVVVVWW